MRRFVYLAGLLAVLGIAQPSQANISYSYEVTATEGGPAVSNASYNAGSNVVLAVYLVETADNGSQSFLASEGGLFTGGFAAARVSTNGGTSSDVAMRNRNMANTSGTNPFTGSNSATSLNAATGYSGGLASGISSATADYQNGPNDGFNYLPAGVQPTNNSTITVGQYPGAGNGGNAFSGNGGGVFVNGNTITTKIYVGAMVFSAGTAGNSTTYVIGGRNSNDPISWLHQFPLGPSKPTGATSILNSSNPQPFSSTPFALSEGYSGTNAFVGYQVTVSVNAIPEPSSMILGSIAVCGMGFGAYRRRMAKKNNPEAVVA